MVIALLYAVCFFFFGWLVLLTVAFVVLRRRHDRLAERNRSLASSITRLNRSRHTGSQPVVKPAPPFPVPPPSTNPITTATRGRHASP